MPRQDAVHQSWMLVLDESIRGDMMTVGGFFAPYESLQVVTESWRTLKRETFGLRADAELKHSMAPDHPTRAELDANGWTQQERMPEMIAAISNLNVAIVADTILDLRPQEGRHAQDYYLDALAWCIRRLANHVSMCLGSAAGPHAVLVDMPPQAPAAQRREGLSDHVQELYKRPSTASFDKYYRMFNEPEEFGQRTAPALGDIGFLPGLNASHARHNDLLQVADVIAGTVRDFCHHNLSRSTQRGELPRRSYEDTNFYTLAGLLHRSRSGDAEAYGFDVFPPRHLARRSILDLVNLWSSEEGESSHPLCSR